MSTKSLKNKGSSTKLYPDDHKRQAHFPIKRIIKHFTFKYAILEVEKSLGFAQFSIAILGHFQAKS